MALTRLLPPPRTSQMSPVVNVSLPGVSVRLPNNQRVASHHMYRQHHHAMAPMRAFQTYSGANQKQSTSEAIQSLLHSNLASSVVGMADRAAAQGKEQVRRLSAAAKQAASQALEHVPIHGNKLADTPPADAHMPFASNARTSSALEQASFQTNESQFRPNIQ